MPVFCPCGSGRPQADAYADQAAAETAALMRRHGSACVLRLRDGLLAAGHPRMHGPRSHSRPRQVRAPPGSDCR